MLVGLIALVLLISLVRVLIPGSDGVATSTAPIASPPATSVPVSVTSSPSPSEQADRPKKDTKHEHERNHPTVSNPWP